MCGRFVLSAETKEIENLVPKLRVGNIVINSYNITPYENIAIIYNNNNSVVCDDSFWGLEVDSANGYKHRVINSRFDSLQNKTFYKNLLNNNRCLIPASGYYEWKKVNNSNKLPYYIKNSTSNLITFAGIYKYSDNSKNILRTSLSCSIITVNPIESIKFIHNRMPLIINEKHRNLWLNGRELSNYEYNSIIESSLELSLDFYNVSLKINNPDFNSRECILPVINESLFGDY